ncbi:MAG: pyridoxamine 5'-phosphate oxidase family protein [Lachnospiraceae bacterium]|nr:pyridoxamine 5'-phosphate oxidase family protein [Lachnospiraceae bacterium]
MADIISKELKDIIADPNTLKVLATVDKNGVPHVVFKGSFHVNEEGNLVFYEVLESAQSNKNLVHSIWFDKKVAINILSADKQSFEIVGKPLKSITAGREFEKTYIALRESKGDIDLAAIWIIEPEQIKNETFSVRVSEDEEKYPILKHLDRLFVQ